MSLDEEDDERQEDAPNKGRIVVRPDGSAVIKAGEFRITVGPSGVVISSRLGVCTIGAITPCREP